MTDHTDEGLTWLYASEPAVTCDWFALRSARLSGDGLLTCRDPAQGRPG
jgi:hypothetical protein